MSSYEDDLIATRRSLNTSNFPTSDEEEQEVGSGIPNQKISNTDVEDIDFAPQSISSNKSGSVSSRRTILRSSSSSDSEDDETTVGSRKSSPPSKKSPRDKTSESSNSSQSSHHSVERSHSTQSQTSPADPRKFVTSDSDEDVVAPRKSKKIFDSDEYESDGDKNESSQKILTNEEDANNREEPPEGRISKKKRIRKRLAVSSDSDDSNDESNNTTSNVVENAHSEENHDSESECPNLTTKEKRKKRLEKLNEQKRCEFAKLAEEKKARNSKKDKNESSTHVDCEQPQPSAEESQNKPRKFLLLSDDDLSDNEGSREPLVHSDSENYEEEKQTKSKKRKNVEKTKNNNSKKRKNQEEKLDGAEDDPNTKKQKKPRSRAPKSNATPKEPKESKRKSKKQKEAMLEIKSTTQKMIREGRISLPYHQPKQRSLDEFLQRRSDVPSIPLRASYDILSIAGEHLMKKEEEIAEFYKSESEHSEGEQITEDTEMSRQNNSETNAPESSVISCDNFFAEHDPPEVEAPSNNEMKSLENVSSAERDVNAVEACNSPDSTSGELGNGEPNVSRVDALPNCDGQRTSEEPETVKISENTAAIVTDQSVLSVTESDSVVDSSLNFAPKEKDSIPEEVDELLTKRDDVSENTGGDAHEEVVDVTDETTLQHCRPDSAEENEVRPSENVDNFTLEQDTEDFNLEIEDSCPAETHVESGANTSTNPPLRVDPEVVRKKKLEFLSSRNVRFSDPKLNKDNNDSVVHFEIDGLPESTEIKSFMEKFASHVNAKKKTKKQSTKMNVTNVQTDSQGEIIDVIKETLTLKSHDDEDNDVEDKFTLPGSKHSFFKDTMLKTLISKKTSNWEKYQDEKYSSFDGDDRNYDDDTNEEKEEKDTDEPNFDPYHPEDEPDDEDLVEDDVDFTDEPNKKKNEFVDEEAEVDFDEDENIVGGCDEEADLEGECSADDEEEPQTENEGENSEDESETDAKNNPPDDDDNGEEIDSDEELLNSFLKKQEGIKSPPKQTRGPSKLFKSNTTGEDLENKVLRLESGSQVDDFTNTQIFSVCSGKFATQIVPPISNDTSQFLADSQFPDDSQGFNLSMQETNDGFQSKEDVTSNALNKSSFLLSDDESDTEELFNKKRKALQLEDSDNEESAKSIDGEEGECPDPENEDNPDDEDVVEDEQDEDDLDGELGYNSEEEIISYKDTKPTEFFENEAELSESEWGSEDENEKDLDYFEKEAGDDEDIDNDRLKEELGRIHMRHLMDDDQKNVRLLQEILLEDGDMHADGQRSRKFQWKNLDGESFLKNFFGDSDDENVLIDDNDLNSDEKSKNWRQMRHEREIFLSKQEKNNDLLLSADDEGTNFVRISSAARVITKSTVSEEPTKPVPHKSPNAKFSFHTKLKCGSFLSRGQQLLSRLANNVGESKESNIQGAKNSRNFLFAAKSVDEVVQKTATTENQVEKRKISSKSVMARKKLKLIDGASNQTAPLRPGLLAQLASSD